MYLNKENEITAPLKAYLKTEDKIEDITLCDKWIMTNGQWIKCKNYKYSLTHSLNYGYERTYYFYEFEDVKSYISNNKSDLTGYLKLSTLRYDYKEISCDALFANCVNLTEIDLNDFDTSNNTNMYRMFQFCSSVKNIKCGKLITKNVTNMDLCFSNCSVLEIHLISDWDVGNVTSFYGMFYNNGMETIDISKWTPLKATSFGDFFSNCNSLKEVIGLEKLYSPVVTYISGMFWKCYNLETIDLSSFDTSLCTSYGWMFSDCFSVTEAYGRTQEDCDILNASIYKPDNINFVVKSTYSAALSTLSIQPAETEEEQIQQLTEMGVDYTTLEEV